MAKRGRGNLSNVPAHIQLENGWNKLAVLERVCIRLINGDSLRLICSNHYFDENNNKIKLPELEWFPDRATVLRWMNETESDFAASIAHARELQADSLVDDIGHIANEVAAYRIDANAGRVAMWAKMWYASKLRPKKFGDKIEHTVVGKVEKIDYDSIISIEQAENAHKKLLERLRS